MKNIVVLLILASCSHWRLPINKDYEDQSLLMCSFALKPQNTGYRGYDVQAQKFDWKDWNWKNESKYIRIDHNSVKKVLILGKKTEGSTVTRMVSSVYFVNYTAKDNKSFWKKFETENNVRTAASDIEKLKVSGWSALGQDFTYMTDFGIHRIYDSQNCGVSCIRYFLVKKDKTPQDLKKQCDRQIAIFEREGQGPSFVHLEYEEEY